MNTTNMLTLTQIGLQLATQLKQVIATQAQANAEGRDVSDEEVMMAAEGASAAIAALKATKSSASHIPSQGAP